MKKYFLIILLIASINAQQNRTIGDMNDDGEINVIDVVLLVSNILDDTVDENLNFAWHLDMVTKVLKPFVLTEVKNYNFDLPSRLDCISKNFWF